MILRHRDPQRLLRLLIVTVAVGVSSWASVTLTRHLGEVSPIWLSNGVLLAALLQTPRRAWPSMLVSGALADVLAHMLAHDAMLCSLGLAAANSTEVVIALTIMRGWNRGMTACGSRKVLLRFGFACLAGSTVSAVLAAELLSAIKEAPYAVVLRIWLCGDLLGLLVVTPVVLCFGRHRQPQWKSAARRVEVIAIWAGLLGVSGMVFAQTRYPLLFLVTPLLLLVAARLGPQAASVALMAEAVLASGSAVTGHGPFSLDPQMGAIERAMLVQLFLAISLLLIATVEGASEQRRRMDRKHRHANQRLRASEEKLRMIADHVGDIIIQYRPDSSRSYVSPASKAILGYEPAELMAMPAGLPVHPDDRDHVTSQIAEACLPGTHRTYSYRMKHRDGTFVWVESCWTTLAAPGGGHTKSTEIVAVLRDISARKAAEEELAAAQAELERLATTDGLTGIANRRCLEERLNQEWFSGARHASPVSLLILDVDCFKAFNDRFGHPQGDACLCAIATTLAGCVHRPGDLAARYGGEEFVLLLPNTDNEGAVAVAEHIRSSVVELHINHPGSPIGMVTVSIGVATLAPRMNEASALLVSGADRALYAAKNTGRNKVINAQSSHSANVISLPVNVRAERLS